MRRAVGGAVPGRAVTSQHLSTRYALLGNQPLQRGKPVAIISYAGIGISSALGPLDLLSQRRCPLGPGEHTAPLKRECHGEGLRFPRLAEHRSLLVMREAGQRCGCLARESLVELRIR